MTDKRMHKRNSLSKTQIVASIHSLKSTLWDWLKIFSEPTGATIIASLGIILANILVFRLLSLHDAGLFTLLIAISQTMFLLGTLGQPLLLRRIYSLQPPGKFDWLRDLFSTIMLLIPGVIIGCFLSGSIYNFIHEHTLFILFMSLGLITVDLISKILLSQRYYMWGSLLLRLPNSLLILPVLVLPLVPDSDRLRILLILHASLTWLVVVMGFFKLSRLVRRGTMRLMLHKRWQGFLFLLSSATKLLPYEGFVAIAGAMISAEQLAGFAAIAQFTRPFNLLYGIQNQVFTTEFARKKRVRYGRIVLVILSLTILMSVSMVLVLPALSNWIYSGRYESFVYLSHWLVLSFSLKLVEALPHSHAIGRTPIMIVNRFIGTQAFFALLGFFMVIILVERRGLLGLAWAMCLMFFIRALISYLFMWRTHKTLPAV